MHTDRSALLCDLAETYGIYDVTEHPARRIALFAAGLRDNSRIKMKLSGVKIPEDTILLAYAVDRLSLLVWQKTKDGAKNRNRPESIAERLLFGDSKKKKQGLSYATPEDFWAARKAILEKIERS